MRLQDDIIPVEDRLTKTFMNWRVTITVWHNTPTTLQPDEFIWVIRFQSRDGVTFNWTIPWPDLYSMLPDLARNMNQDVAEVIYEALWEWFNDTLWAYQLDSWPIREGDIINRTRFTIQFPPREYFRGELRLIEIEKWGRLHPTIHPTITIGNANRASMDDMQNAFEQFYREREQYLTYDHASMITAWATPRAETAGIAGCVNYLTSDEYERRKANGELNPNTVYLVINQH